MINYELILLVTILGLLSPGPSVLLIANTAMNRGRGSAMNVALGVTTGSIIWSSAAALGMAAVMAANVWLFELFRYAGAAYLLWLSYKSAKSAWQSSPVSPTNSVKVSTGRAFFTGLAVHLTNPKPVLFFGSLYALLVPSTATISELASVVLTIGGPTLIAFVGYAFAFSSQRVIAIYSRMKRWIEGTFALVFGSLGVGVLLSRSPS
ncbi:LysE family translocator [Roseobacteraceae bacterium S113]